MDRQFLFGKAQRFQNPDLCPLIFQHPVHSRRCDHQSDKKKGHGKYRSDRLVLLDLIGNHRDSRMLFRINGRDLPVFINDSRDIFPAG